MDQNKINELDPSSIMKLSTSYWESQTLLTANRIGLFDILSNKESSSDEIAEALHIKPRPTLLLLNACVALGLLEKSNDKYRNSPISQAFLVSGKPSYLGNAIRYSDDLYQTWGRLEEVLKQDKPPMPPETYLGSNEQSTRHFVMGMHNRALSIGQAMLHLVDLTGKKQMLDVGGGPGTYSALFTQKYPELYSRVLDLERIVDIAKDIVKEMGADKVSMLPGDYHEVDFPPGNDVVLISGVFHRENIQDCNSLIQRAKNSLVADGLLVVSDVFTDAGGTTPTFATLFGVNMMLTAENGCVYEDTEISQLLASSGFANVSTKNFPPPLPHKIITGIKK